MRFLFIATMLATIFSVPALATPLATTASSNAYRGAMPTEIVPSPREATFADGNLAFADLSIKLDGEEPELKWAARDFAEEIAMRGLPALSGNKKFIHVGTILNENLKAQLVKKSWTLEGDEAYAVLVNNDGASVIGATGLGAYRGMQSLRQLVSQNGLRFAEIRDWPALAFRGAMIYLDKDSGITNDVLIPLLAKLKFNRVLVMANYVRWNASKSVWHPNGASTEEAQRVANKIRDHGMEAIPLIETLSHANWMFYNPQTNSFNANKDWWQDPEAGTPYAYDTLNENVYKFLLPVLSEAIAVFKPKYIHIGHDEVKSVNRFPARDNGKAVGFEQLFIDDTLKLYNHLKNQNVGTIIWHDTAMNDAYREKIAPALPKDTIIMDWNYDNRNEYPSPRIAQSAGFSVVGASWKVPGNTEGYAKSIERDKGLGMLQARWTGYFGNATMSDGQTDQGVAYINAGQSFWFPQATTSSNFANTAATLYRDAWHPSSLLAVPGKLIDLSSVATRKLTDTDEKQWIQKGAGTDLSNLPTGNVQLGAYNFLITDALMLHGARPGARELPEAATLELNSKAGAIAFLHTTGWLANQYRTKIGSYKINYDDNTSQIVPLEYGKNISSWTDTTIRSVYCDPVWRGQTKDGLSVGVNVFVWTNPKPEKTIINIEIKSEGLDANPTLLGLTLLDKSIELPKP